MHATLPHVLSSAIASLHFTHKPFTKIVSPNEITVSPNEKIFSPNEKIVSPNEIIVSPLSFNFLWEVGETIISFGENIFSFVETVISFGDTIFLKGIDLEKWLENSGLLPSVQVNISVMGSPHPLQATRFILEEVKSMRRHKISRLIK